MTYSVYYILDLKHNLNPQYTQVHNSVPYTVKLYNIPHGYILILIVYEYIRVQNISISMEHTSISMGVLVLVHHTILLARTTRLD